MIATIDETTMNSIILAYNIQILSALSQEDGDAYIKALVDSCQMPKHVLDALTAFHKSHAESRLKMARLERNADKYLEIDKD